MRKVNYQRLFKTAKRLIERFGTDTVFRSYAEVPGAQPNLPPVRTPDNRTLQAVFTRYKVKEIDGTLITTKDRRVLVAGDLPANFNLSSTVVGADGLVWRVITIEPLLPATVGLLYTLQVRQ